MAGAAETINASVEFIDLFPKQQEVYDVWQANPPLSTSYMGYGGTVGGGKTALIADIAARSMLLRYPGIRILLGRSDLLMLEQGALKDFLDIVEPLAKTGMFRHNQQARIIQLRQPTWPQGVWSELRYHPMQSKERLMGPEYGMILIDEASEIPEDVAQWLGTRLRQKLPKPVRHALNTFPQNIKKWGPNAGEIKYLFLCASNPNGSWFDEWFYRGAALGGLINGLTLEEQAAAGNHYHFIHALPSDNPHLPPGYYEKQMASLTPAQREKLVMGRFDIYEGAVFPDFRDTSAFYRKPAGSLWDRDELPKYTKVIGGIDMGGADQKAHYTSAIVGIRTEGNRIIQVDEFHRRGPRVRDELYAWMFEMEAKWARKIGSRITWRASKDQDWAINMLQGTFHIRPSLGKFNSRDRNVLAIAEHLQPDPILNIPRLLYLPHLKEWPRSMKRYEHDPKDPGKFIRKNDDMMDATQYQFEELERRAEDPAQLRNLLPVVRAS